MEQLVCYNVICAEFEKAFSVSQFKEKVGVYKNKDGSVSFSFCAQVPINVSFTKSAFRFDIKNDYFEMLDPTFFPIGYEIILRKSKPDIKRISCANNDSDFRMLTEYLFRFAEKYVDEHYIPDHTFGCCSRYLECSDMRKCINPDYLYAKGCTYKKHLDTGKVFYGVNRNI